MREKISSKSVQPFNTFLIFLGHIASSGFTSDAGVIAFVMPHLHLFFFNYLDSLAFRRDIYFFLV